MINRSLISDEGDNKEEGFHQFLQAKLKGFQHVLGMIEEHGA